MRIRHLIAVLLVLGLGATGAMAETYTVYPTGGINSTGYTNHFAKTDGEALVYGGASTGTTRQEAGYFKFDLSSIPDSFAAAGVEFHFYVNNTLWPYWSVTPVSLDPEQFGSTPALLWEDISAENEAGFYNFQNEDDTYETGWKTLELGGTAIADITAALGQDWFTLGASSRDSDAQYFLEIDGHGDTNVPYLVVHDNLPPSDLTCSVDGEFVTLSWINNSEYDLIEVYSDDELVATLAGAATTITSGPASEGAHCYHVCGIIDVYSGCSDDCCVIVGYENQVLLWDFEDDDGGFIVDGTGGWEWGAPTYGPCADSADGNVWATDLDGGYVNSACWLLESGPITIDDEGGFICFDHCYDIEEGMDGGVVWFTTDDYWYYNFEPVEGTDGVIGSGAACTWVAGRAGFTGDSGGWVTDCWDFTDPFWLEQDVKIRFAFGSDDATTQTGWMVDNITILTNTANTIDCQYNVVPLSGTVPFNTTHQIYLANTLEGPATLTRLVRARIAVTTGSGMHIDSWKAGSLQIQPDTIKAVQFNQMLPAQAIVIGDNIFALYAEDITPAPYNQPPYPPSGDACTSINVVVANAP